MYKNTFVLFQTNFTFGWINILAFTKILLVCFCNMKHKSQLKLLMEYEITTYHS